MIRLEVVYASIDTQVILQLSFGQAISVEQAIYRSGILEQFPEIDLLQQTVGCFSKRVELTSLVEDGARLEIYRPLLSDPKEARRRRAKK